MAVLDDWCQPWIHGKVGQESRVGPRSILLLSGRCFRFNFVTSHHFNMAPMRWTLLAAIASFVRAEINLYDVDGSSLSEALLYSGNHTDQPAFLFERSLLEERQYCAVGYGTCRKMDP